MATSFRTPMDPLQVCLTVCFCAACVARSELKRDSDEPWDLDGPCQPYIKKNVFSHDNTTCNRVIFENYLISYVSEVSNTLTQNIWQHSRCSSCVIIDWEFEKNSTDYRYHNNTIEFQNKLYSWRRCVSNYTSAHRTNYTVICDKCLNSFNTLFEFYWAIYVAPEVDFCLDVETIMNDTTNLWHNVWHCPDDRTEEPRDWTLLGYSLAFLSIITALFYTSSYIQSEEIQRRLVQYSRLDAPGVLRSHLLSSSALDADYPSTSRAHPDTAPVFGVQ